MRSEMQKVTAGDSKSRFAHSARAGRKYGKCCHLLSLPGCTTMDSNMSFLAMVKPCTPENAGQVRNPLTLRDIRKTRANRYPDLHYRSSAVRVPHGW
jgi:hypothetical protein